MKCFGSASPCRCGCFTTASTISELTWCPVAAAAAGLLPPVGDILPASCSGLCLAAIINLAFVVLTYLSPSPPDTPIVQQQRKGQQDPQLTLNNPCGFMCAFCGLQFLPAPEDGGSAPQAATHAMLQLHRMSVASARLLDISLSERHGILKGCRQVFVLPFSPERRAEGHQCCRCSRCPSKMLAKTAVPSACSPQRLCLCHADEFVTWNTLSEAPRSMLCAERALMGFLLCIEANQISCIGGGMIPQDASRDHHDTRYDITCTDLCARHSSLYLDVGMLLKHSCVQPTERGIRPLRHIEIDLNLIP